MRKKNLLGVFVAIYKGSSKTMTSNPATLRKPASLDMKPVASQLTAVADLTSSRRSPVFDSETCVDFEIDIANARLREIVAVVIFLQVW
jgi:hypothetical protein